MSTTAGPKPPTAQPRRDAAAWRTAQRGRKRLILLGSTGSIGVNTLDVVAHLNESGAAAIDVVGLAAGRRVDELIEQARRFNVPAVALADGECDAAVRQALPDAEVFTGPQAALQLIEQSDATDVAAAVVGSAGLPATLAAIRRGATIGLANKETLVAAGPLVTPLVRRHGARLIPVDSEHSAIFQCLQSRAGSHEPRAGSHEQQAASREPDSGPSPLRGRLGGGDAASSEHSRSRQSEPSTDSRSRNHPPPAPPSREGGQGNGPRTADCGLRTDSLRTDSPRTDFVKRIVLTASGGPFRTASKADIQNATVEQALKHPTWNMGPKITIDSATMMNKALEIIEAHWLFDLPPSKIEVIIHPQSIAHSFVEFEDHSVLAQLGPPDMRTPIQYALTYPDRPPGCSEALDWTTFNRLDFEPPDFDRFPALKLAYDVIEAGGTAGAVFNAANEAAVAAFLERRIRFGRIVELAAEALSALPPVPAESLEVILDADQAARGFVEERVG